MTRAVATRRPAGRCWVEAGAEFDATRRYRYRLWRVWDPALDIVTFCMLNPSTADETVEDPTVRRCIAFARAWGAGALVVVNAFALRSTDPQALYRARDPVGSANDAHIERARGETKVFVAAWGRHGALRGRGSHLLARLGRESVHCLGVTKEGHPRHPLYLRGDLQPARLP